MTPRHHRVRFLTLFTLLLGLTLGLPAWACLNHYGKLNVHGESVPRGRESYRHFISRLTDHWEHTKILSDPPPAEPAPEAAFTVRSDYAVTLVHRGESRKAVLILESVEKEHPGEYIVAANLGTAYELSGDLDKAQQWIGEGIRRNAKAHAESEWLHLKILEARQSLAKDPDWAKSHGVLDLDFGSDAIPRKPTIWPKDSAEAESLIQSLTYQLSERLAFVPPPDALVGGMIADLANLLALYRSVDHAIPVYELALQYQPTQTKLIASRLAASMEVRRQETPMVQGVGSGLLIAIACLAIVIAVLLWLRNRSAAA